MGEENQQEQTQEQDQSQLQSDQPDQPWNQGTPVDSPPTPAPGMDPSLPETGDDSDFEEEPVGDAETPLHPEHSEERDEPNDLSNVDKEFDE